MQSEVRESSRRASGSPGYCGFDDAHRIIDEYRQEADDEAALQDKGGVGRLKAGNDDFASEWLWPWNLWNPSGSVMLMTSP